MKSEQIAGLLFWLMAAPAMAQAPPPIIGHATVQDGDTIIVAGRTVRLQGIDAPEMGQSCDDAAGKPWRCGQAAAWALDRIIAGRIVTCQQDARDAEDRYGRALAICRAGSIDIGEWIIAAGYAVAYRRYLDWPDGSPRDHKAAYLATEAKARAARIGIWQGRFDLPEIWRRAHQRPRG